MTQPYWNPQKVNEMVQNAMPTCDNSRYPIQEFFRVESDPRYVNYTSWLRFIVIGILIWCVFKVFKTV